MDKHRNDATRRTGLLAASLRVLRMGAAAALGLGVVTFLFSFVANGISWQAGLDWARKLLLVVGALMLVTGGCGIFVSGRTAPRPRTMTTPSAPSGTRSACRGAPP